jgi:hypothetical protein
MTISRHDVNGLPSVPVKNGDNSFAVPRGRFAGQPPGDFRKVIPHGDAGMSTTAR